MRFIHHPDGKIIIDDLMMEVSEFLQMEPAYSLPSGYIGRVFEASTDHKLLDQDNIATGMGDIDDVVLLNYLSRKAEYEAALAALHNGAQVIHDNGELIIFGPPSLTPVDGQVEANALDVELITCDVSNATYTGQIIWTVTAPDGTVNTVTDNMVDGVATLAFSAAQNNVGIHIVKAETSDYGFAVTSVEAV